MLTTKVRAQRRSRRRNSILADGQPKSPAMASALSSLDGYAASSNDPDYIKRSAVSWWQEKPVEFRS